MSHAVMDEALGKNIVVCLDGTGNEVKAKRAARVDAANEAHDLIMSVFGGVREGERKRIPVRVRTAIATLARSEGHYLGGRPPCG